MWITSKRGLLVNTYHLQTVDVFPPDPEGESEDYQVIGEGGVLDARPVLLYWGTQEECEQYVANLGRVLSVRNVFMAEHSSLNLNGFEPKL